MDILCRACAQTTDIAVNLFTPIMTTKLGEQLTYCAADLLNELTCRYLCFQDSNDAQPQYICKMCIDSAQTAVNFKRMIEKNNQIYLNEKDGLKEDEQEMEREFSELIPLVTLETNNECDLKELNGIYDAFEIGDFMIREMDMEPLPPNDNNPNNLDQLKMEMCESNPTHSLVSNGQSSKSRSRNRTKKKPTLECPHCNAKLSSEGNLRIHLRTHTNERPYQCEYCQKMFTQKSNMLTHTRLHTGERPYKCGTCSKSFAQMANILSHQKACKAKKRKLMNASKSKRNR